MDWTSLIGFLTKMRPVLRRQMQASPIGLVKLKRRSLTISSYLIQKLISPHSIAGVSNDFLVCMNRRSFWYAVELLVVNHTLVHNLFEA
jgi:hypothetical protein